MVHVTEPSESLSVNSYDSISGYGGKLTMQPAKTSFIWKFRCLSDQKGLPLLTSLLALCIGGAYFRLHQGSSGSFKLTASEFFSLLCFSFLFSSLFLSFSLFALFSFFKQCQSFSKTSMDWGDHFPPSAHHHHDHRKSDPFAAQITARKHNSQT